MVADAAYPRAPGPRRLSNAGSGHVVARSGPKHRTREADTFSSRRFQVLLRGRLRGSPWVIGVISRLSERSSRWGNRGDVAAAIIRRTPGPRCPEMFSVVEEAETHNGGARCRDLRGEAMKDTIFLHDRIAPVERRPRRNGHMQRRYPSFTQWRPVEIVDGAPAMRNRVAGLSTSSVNMLRRTIAMRFDSALAAWV